MKRILLWIDAHISDLWKWAIYSLAISSSLLVLIVSIKVNDMQRWATEINIWGAEQEENINQLTAKIEDLQRQLEAKQP